LRVLCVVPHMDLLTSISAELGLRFAEWAKGQGHDVRVLYSWEATRLPLLISLFGEPDFIYYAGHGSLDTLLGNEFFLGLVTPFNANWLRERVTAVMACLSASVLGKQVVEEGGYAYVGATDLLYAAFNELDHNYLDDWLSYMMELPKGIVSNLTLGEALENLKREALSYADTYTGLENGDWYSSTFRHNANVYTVVGNSNLRLSDVTKREQAPMGFVEGLQYLFREDVLRASWPDAVRSLMSFGVVAGTIAGLVVPSAVDFVAERTGAPKPFAELAKKALVSVAAMAPT